MELKIVKFDEEKKEALVEVEGGTIGFVNLLRDELWKDPNVLEAAWVQEHPYLSEPKIYVRVSRGNPLTALEKASKGIEKKSVELFETFQSSLKKI